jgi:uncharacterized integral membrane protein
LRTLPERKLGSPDDPSVFHIGNYTLWKNGYVMKNLKSAAAIVLGALLMLIAFQNMASVELTFLFWTFEARRIVLITICVGMGFLLGRITSTHKQPSQKD